MIPTPGEEIPRDDLGPAFVIAPGHSAQGGLYARGWREGFARGAADVARVAAREIDDLHALTILDRLAQQYQLPGDD
jgi:hypothetical protein